MTIRDLIEMMQREVESHASGAVKEPLTMDSEIVFMDACGNDVSVVVGIMGGNWYDPALTITVY